MSMIGRHLLFNKLPHNTWNIGTLPGGPALAYIYHYEKFYEEYALKPSSTQTCSWVNENISIVINNLTTCDVCRAYVITEYCELQSLRDILGALKWSYKKSESIVCVSSKQIFTTWCKLIKIFTKNAQNLAVSQKRHILHIIHYIHEQTESIRHQTTPLWPHLHLHWRCGDCFFNGLGVLCLSMPLSLQQCYLLLNLVHFMCELVQIQILYTLCMREGGKEGGG